MSNSWPIIEPIEYAGKKYPFVWNMPPIIRARYESDKLVRYYDNLVPDPNDKSNTWRSEWRRAKELNELVHADDPNPSNLDELSEAMQGEIHGAGSAFAEVIYVARKLSHELK